LQAGAPARAEKLANWDFRIEDLGRSCKF
jgi:hypothetical protein